MSAAHTSRRGGGSCGSGSVVTANLRPNTFGATGNVCAESVVPRTARRAFARSPAACMSRATRFSPWRRPWSASSAWMRGLP